jgi:hypothetical protein
MRINQIIKLLIISLSFISCDGDYHNIKIKGKVFDSNNKLVIKNAKIKINCWVYNTEIWESQIFEYSTTSNDYGLFEILIKKGNAIDIYVSANDYKIHQVSLNIKKNNIDLDVPLIDSLHQIK